MLLSIIIPVYNEEENLQKRLSFLEEQAKRFPLEIIVSNSPETNDNTEQVCAQYSVVRLYNCHCKGRAKQMNFGVSKASGDFFLFLHADVQLPDDFYTQIKEASHDYDVGFFAYIFDKHTLLLDFNSQFTKKDGLFAGGGDQCQFFKKETFKQLRGFNEEYCIMEDFEMIDRVRKFRIPYTIIQSYAIVSTRKYAERSWLKVNFINAYVFLRYKLGTPPIKLRKLYQHLLREQV